MRRPGWNVQEPWTTLLQGRLGQTRLKGTPLPINRAQSLRSRLRINLLHASQDPARRHDDRPVIAARGEGLAILAEGHRGDGVVVAPQDGGGGVGVSRVPEPHRPVAAARGEDLAILAEGHRGDGVVVALEEGAGIGPAQGPAERFIGSCRDLWAADPGVAAFGLFGLMAVSARSEVARAWFGRS